MPIILSIIIPVYKVEQYIRKCLDSVIIAPYLMEKMEVLIINDGTPDNSAELSREYVKRFPNVFRQIDKENGGHGSVWNMGLKEAKGKYTRFLDSDDWLENLDLLIEYLEKCDADLIITPTLCHCPNQEVWKLEIKDMEFGRVYDADCFDWLHNRSHGNYVLHHSCTYKTELFKPYLPLFLEKQPYDDVILGAVSIISAKTLVAYDFILYHYLMDREGQSISLEKRKKNTQAQIKTYKQVIQFVEQHPLKRESTKSLFFAEKLPKKYNYGYKGFFILPYNKNKQLTKEWDDWVRANNPTIRTNIIILYRILPYWLYWLIVKIVGRHERV